MMEDMDQRGRCLTCRYAQRLDSRDYISVPDWCDYECHRRAPEMVPQGTGSAISVWPGVSGFDWCGDYRALNHEEDERGEGQEQARKNQGA